MSSSVNSVAGFDSIFLFSISVLIFSFNALSSAVVFGSSVAVVAVFAVFVVTSVVTVVSQLIIISVPVIISVFTIPESTIPVTTSQVIISPVRVSGWLILTVEHQVKSNAADNKESTFSFCIFVCIRK